MVAFNILLSLLPVLILCFMYAYWVDRRLFLDYKTWLYVFVIGAIASVPAYWIEYSLVGHLLHNTGWLGSIIEAFAFVALIEEAIKFIFFRFGICTSNWLKRPLDYLTAGLVLGLGFAMPENLMYAYSYDWITMIARIFTAVPAHAMFGVIMGYFMYLYIDKKVWKYGLLSLLIPVLLHGLYDFFVIQTISDALLPGSLIVLIVGICYSIYLIKKLSRSNQQVTTDSDDTPSKDKSETMPTEQITDFDEDYDPLGNIILGEESE